MHVFVANLELLDDKLCHKLQLWLTSSRNGRDNAFAVRNVMVVSIPCNFVLKYLAFNVFLFAHKCNSCHVTLFVKICLKHTYIFVVYYSINIIAFEGSFDDSVHM